VFEKRMLMMIFGPEGRLTRRLEEIAKRGSDWYPSPSVILVIKSTLMRWAGHVGRMGGGEEKFIQVFSGGTRRKGRIILKCILKKYWRASAGLMWLRVGTSGGLL
jgi:hypothetical protein